MAISAAMVRSLREKTGLPMMECKKALTEAGGDEAGAMEWLKQHASAKFEKRADRETAEGRVACYVAESGDRAGMVELRCETAPVAGTDDFVNLAKLVAQVAAQDDAPSPDTILAKPSPADASKTLDDEKQAAFAKLRENLNVHRVAAVSGHVAHYVHHNSQVGVLVEFNATCPAELSADICMHVAAMNPPYLKREDVEPERVSEEQERAKAEAAGKPPQIIDKIVAGKMDRWYSEVSLLEQPFVKDDKQSVTQVLKAVSPDLTIKRFVRFQVGLA